MALPDRSEPRKKIRPSNNANEMNEGELSKNIVKTEAAHGSAGYVCLDIPTVFRDVRKHYFFDTASFIFCLTKVEYKYLQNLIVHLTKCVA